MEPCKLCCYGAIDRQPGQMNGVGHQSVQSMETHLQHLTRSFSSRNYRSLNSDSAHTELFSTRKSIDVDTPLSQTLLFVRQLMCPHFFPYRSVQVSIRDLNNTTHPSPKPQILDLSFSLLSASPLSIGGNRHLGRGPEATGSTSAGRCGGREAGVGLFRKSQQRYRPLTPRRAH